MKVKKMNKNNQKVYDKIVTNVMIESIVIYFVVIGIIFYLKQS